jgi:hypothetical protein
LVCSAVRLLPRSLEVIAIGDNDLLIHERLSQRDWHFRHAIARTMQTVARFWILYIHHVCILRSLHSFLWWHCRPKM